MTNKMSLDKALLWQRFCEQYRVQDEAVPLFGEENGFVKTMRYGKDQRWLLQRHQKMDALIVREVNKLLNDFQAQTDHYQGVIYMMFWPSETGPIPLYIGKSEKYGKQGNNLSANIKNIERNQGNFCRWGYNYAYHIGDLSACVCLDHPSQKQLLKYRSWANSLFENANQQTNQPILKRETLFWMKAWGREDIGPWAEFGATKITFLEYLLIGLAGEVFPDTLLNREGINR